MLKSPFEDDEVIVFCFALNLLKGILSSGLELLLFISISLVSMQSSLKLASLSSSCWDVEEAVVEISYTKYI